MEGALMAKKETIQISLRISRELWKRLKLLQIDGKIKSINQAAIEGLEIIADREEANNAQM
jgi:hypothetical protein